MLRTLDPIPATARGLRIEAEQERLDEDRHPRAEAFFSGPVPRWACCVEPVALLGGGRERVILCGPCRLGRGGTAQTTRCWPPPRNARGSTQPETSPTGPVEPPTGSATAPDNTT